MFTSYTLDLVENCLECRLHRVNFFCNFSTPCLRAFDDIKFTSAYPKGAVLFTEGQSPRGIFMLCQGTVKLSCTSAAGKTLVFKVSKPGEVLGLSASVCSQPYEFTAETLEPCQTNFVKRGDFLRFLGEHKEACLAVAQKLAEEYNATHDKMRTLCLSRSAREKLATLLLRWGNGNEPALHAKDGIKLSLTHEEIANMIGTSRETVTRLLAGMKKQQILHASGATVVIRDKGALMAMAKI